MTPYEIATSYKNAKNKKKQLQILSQINLIPKEAVWAIIKDYNKSLKKTDIDYNLKKIQHRKNTAPTVSGGPRTRKWEPW